MDAVWGALGVAWDPPVSLAGMAHPLIHWAHFVTVRVRGVH